MREYMKTLLSGIDAKFDSLFRKEEIAADAFYTTPFQVDYPNRITPVDYINVPFPSESSAEIGQKIEYLTNKNIIDPETAFIEGKVIINISNSDMIFTFSRIENIGNETSILIYTNSDINVEFCVSFGGSFGFHIPSGDDIHTTINYYGFRFNLGEKYYRIKDPNYVNYYLNLKYLPEGSSEVHYDNLFINPKKELLYYLDHDYPLFIKYVNEGDGKMIIPCTYCIYDNKYALWFMAYDAVSYGIIIDKSNDMVEVHNLTK